MKLKSFLKLAAFCAALFSAAMMNVSAASRVLLRPQPAEEAVRILKLAGREEERPEGRVITQGLAAIKGFALGLKKGIGGSLLFDLATSNATTELINKFNATALISDFPGIDMTALLQMFKWGGSENSPSEDKYKKMEICFDTIGDDHAFEKQAGRADFETAPPAADSDNVESNVSARSGYFTAVDDTTNTKSQAVVITEINERNHQTCILFKEPERARKRRSTTRKRRLQI